MVKIIKAMQYFIILLLLFSTSGMTASVEGNTNSNSDNSLAPALEESNRFADTHTIQPLTSTNEVTPKANSVKKSTSVKLSGISDPEVLEVHIYNASTSEEISYAYPGNQVTISVLAKGPFNGVDLKVELKRNIVLGTDTVLDSTPFTGITLADTETAWFNSTTFTLDSGLSSFGRNSGDIKEYYVQFIMTTGFPDTVYYRGGEDGAGSGSLTMYGEILLDKVEYYNITNNQRIPVKIVEGGWNLSVRVFFRIIGGPVWDFSLYTNFKYDVKLGVDDTVIGDQAILLLPSSSTGVFIPDQYYYDPIDTNGFNAYLYLPTNRTYGSGVGNTRSIYATLQIGDVSGSNLVDKGYSVDRSTGEIYIKTNIIEFAPTVEFISPTSGDLVSNNSVSILVDIEDINSNYLISSIVLNGSDVLSDYNPSTGLLNTSYDLSGFQADTIVRLELSATDNTGLTGSGILILQVNVPNNLFIKGYKYTQDIIQQNLLDVKQSMSTSFSYTPNNVNLTVAIEPRLTIGVNIYSEEILSFLFPEYVESGTSALVYSIASAPSLNMYLNISLDLGYSFKFDEYSFSGSQNLYFEEFLQQFYLPMGVSTFTLSDIIGERYIGPLTNIELKLSQFLSLIHI